MLIEWVLAAVIMGSPLQAGDSAPEIVFEDIEGEKGTSDQFKDWIIVYSFANRESSDQLMAWRDPAQLAIVKAHPELRVANISFADVSSVPRLFRGVVQPILKGINARATKRLLESYQKANVTVDPNLTKFFLIPDWSGKYLKKFGLEDAAVFRCWIVRNGKVVAVVDANTPHIEQTYVKLFDGYAMPATATP